MKGILSGFKCQGIIRIALMTFMLSTVLYLFGDEGRLINECPLNIDYKVTWPNGDKFGSEAVFTYTISINPELATIYDKQRTYGFSSEFFTTDKKSGSLIPVKSDMKNGDTFTYSQFPITRHLTVKVVEGPVVLLSITVKGYKVEGCPDFSFAVDGTYIQQESELFMTEGEMGNYENSECPMEFNYKVIPLNGNFKAGSEVQINYTFSINPSYASKYDKQRTYSLSSKYFTNVSRNSQLKTVKSDIKDGATFTYSQFPVTGHFTVMINEEWCGYTLDIAVYGYKVKGCPGSCFDIDGKTVQQFSEYYISISNPDYKD